MPTVSASRTAKTIARSRRRTRPVAHFGQSKADLITIGTLGIANQLPPNRTLRVSPRVTNNDSFIPQFDDDACSVAPFVNGYALVATLTVDGVEVASKTKCVAGNVPGVSNVWYPEFEFVTPQEPGTYQYELAVEGEVSGTTVETITGSFEIREDAPDPTDERPGIIDQLLNALEGAGRNAALGAGAALLLFAILGIAI